MKLIEFTYVKTDGSESQRSVVEVMQPSTFMEGIDVSELDDDSFLEFATRYNHAIDAHKHVLMEIMQDYELQNSYKRFKPEAMQNTTIQHI